MLSEAELARLTGEVLAHVPPDQAEPQWEAATTLTIEQLHRVPMLGLGARVQARVLDRSPTAILRSASADADQVSHEEVVDVRLVDDTGGWIDSLDVEGATLIDKLDKVCRSGNSAEFLVIPVPIPLPGAGRRPTQPTADDSRHRVCFHLIDVRSITSHLDMMRATAAEREQAANLLSRMQQCGVSAVDYLLGEAVKVLGIAGLDKDPLLEKLLRFTMQQALSCGFVDQSSAILHAIVVGPPGRGKKILGLAARLVQPVSIEIAPSKLSLAGLVGHSHPQRGGWKSEPGLLARAAHGIAHLQDAHAWSAATVSNLAPALQEVMEDGVVRDSVVGGATRDAPTALLIDLNRSEHTGRFTATPLLAARPVLSRVDLLAELPNDAGQMWRTGQEMLTRTSSPIATLETNAHVRVLRTIVAMLRDRIPTVDLRPALERMRARFDEVGRCCSEMIASDPEAGDLPARLTLSMKRFATAEARGGQRSVAMAADADAALPFLEMKIGFMKTQFAAKKSEMGIDEFIVRAAARGPVRVSELAAEYAARTGTTCCARTMRRHVLSLGGRRTSGATYVLGGARGHRTGGQVDMDATPGGNAIR